MDRRHERRRERLPTARCTRRATEERRTDTETSAEKKRNESAETERWDASAEQYGKHLAHT